MTTREIDSIMALADMYAYAKVSEGTALELLPRNLLLAKLEDVLGVSTTFDRHPKLKPEARPPTLIYTDGGCSPNPGPGGWGFCCEDYEDFGGEIDTTNNRMEMTAIIKAMEWANQCSKGAERWEIYSDSQLCVNTLNQWAANWERKEWTRGKKGEVANLDLVKQAYSLYKSGRFILQWVRGHSGNLGNERADHLAEFGRRLARNKAYITHA